MTNPTLSAHEAQLARSVEKLVSPLIREGVFDNFERALSALLLDYIDRQIALYREKNDKLEAQYKQNFEAFSASIKNKAAPEQEDVWMDWEAALVFLRKWQAVRAQVTQ
ncbi:MAG: hypothetical protein KPEEDBHJ_03479 [Anaerolineales bacterium]|nr:hypothetical protein [Anaerolineales bacterium]